jgi:hypothetical protein
MTPEKLNWLHEQRTYSRLASPSSKGFLLIPVNGPQIEAWGLTNQKPCHYVELPSTRTLANASKAPTQTVRPYEYEKLYWDSDTVEGATSIVTADPNKESLGNTYLAAAGLIGGLGVGLVPFAYQATGHAYLSARRRIRSSRQP